MLYISEMKRLLLVFPLLLIEAAAAPPHPDFSEEYRDHRRRSLLPRNDSGLTDDIDIWFKHAHNEIDDTHELGRSSKNNLMLLKNFQSLNALVVLVKFTDHRDRELPTRDDINTLWNADENFVDDDLPTGSIHRYFFRNSYGRMNIQASVTDWTFTDNTEKYYSFGVSGFGPGRVAPVAYPALDKLDREGYDFSRHDLDGDMVIDALVIQHSGYAAEVGGAACDNRAFQDRIWSHASNHRGSWRSRDGYIFDSYMISSALRGNCGSRRANIGISTHEFIHTWGVPDLYDLNYNGKGIGLYDIMSNPFGRDKKLSHPPHMSPWARMQSGFLDPIEIISDGYYEIEASAISNQIYIIRSNFPEGEYLLIENRQPVEYDALMPGGGLLIWHVDEKQREQRERGYPGQNNWPQNGKHYQVALLQADGRYDLEKGENDGDEDDFFTSGKELGSSPYVHPNTNSYQEGRIRPTGIRIHEISESSMMMHFRVSGLGMGAGIEASVTEAIPTLSPSLKPVANPTLFPTLAPSFTTTLLPTLMPSNTPTFPPTLLPTLMPSNTPTFPPTLYPTLYPSVYATTSYPSLTPTVTATAIPSSNPTIIATTFSTSPPSAMAVLDPNVATYSTNKSLSPTVYEKRIGVESSIPLHGESNVNESLPPSKRPTHRSTRSPLAATPKILSPALKSKLRSEFSNEWVASPQDIAQSVSTTQPVETLYIKMIDMTTESLDQNSSPVASQNTFEAKYPSTTSPVAPISQLSEPSSMPIEQAATLRPNSFFSSLLSIPRASIRASSSSLNSAIEQSDISRNRQQGLRDPSK